MTKNQRILLEIALTLLLTSTALAISSASSDEIIYAFDQNPAGSDDGNEWVSFHNPSNESVDIGNWTFEIGCVITPTGLLALRNWRRGSYGEGYVKNVVDVYPAF
jgi:hypothetical protein